MLIEHEGSRPQVADSAYVAPNAVLCGEVVIGDGTRILFGAVLTAEGGPVEIGPRSIVMENAVLRGRESHPLRLGHSVLVGPHAHLNGATVDDEVFSPPACPSFRVPTLGEVRRCVSGASST